ncbi:hypothetical protein [Streptomyces syringium]|uniref:hypothetical protein n=1 Tax=Streptomyces syringium TaxID=76729 RepID=UPI0033F01B2F
MSYWDADRQQWVEGLPPTPLPPRPARRPSPEAETETGMGPVPPDGFSPDGLPPEGPYYPDEPEDLPRGPSHASILAGVMAGVLLASGIGIGAWALLRDDGDGDSSPGESVPSLSAPATPGPTSDGSSLTGGTTTGGTTGGIGTGGTTTGGTTTGGTGGYPYTPAPTSPGTLSGTPGAPPGYLRTDDPAGFRLDVPRNWRRSTEGASVFYKTPDNKSLIQVFTLNGPEGTPYESLVATEKTVSKNKDYRRLSLARVSGRAGDTAELEYTYERDDGSVRHIIIHAFTGPDRRQYALLVAGPVHVWDTHLEIFKVLLRSFCPTGYCSS